ncbi:MAG: discoidin domain-containing protein [Phycisphaerae bacterium]|nr:discoidin domain-containing protein [Phycisphaerae bacterium]
MINKLMHFNIRKNKILIVSLLAMLVLGTQLKAEFIDRTDAGGIVTFSAENAPGETAAKAFDNTENTKWLIFSNAGWIGFEFADGKGYAISKYTITSANDAAERDPKNWELLGSYDGETWFVVDTRSDETWPDRFVTREFLVENNMAFAMYRLNILSNQAGGLIQIDEIELFEDFSPKASDSTPANLADGVSPSQVFSWKTAWDSANPESPLATVTEHKVYMSNGSLNDPNTYLVATIPAGSPVQTTASYTPAVALDRDGTYLWRVDEVTSGGVLTGDVWEFKTALSIPVVDSSLLEDVFVEVDEQVSFTISAINPFTDDVSGLEYQWHVSPTSDPNIVDSPVDGATSPTLTMAASLANEGTYICKVTITSNGATESSDTATLVIKRLISHWPLDGNVNDVVGGADGTNVGGSFVAGIVGTQAADFDVDTDNMQLPTSAYTGQAWTLSWWENHSETIFATQEWETMLGCGLGDGWDVFEFNRKEVTRFAHGVTGDYVETGIDNPSAAGIWYNHVVTYDPATQMNVWYYNGVKELEWFSGEFSGFDSLIFVGNVRGLSQPYKGSIDDIMLFNYPLDAYGAAGIYTDVAGGSICITYPVLDTTGPDGERDCKVDILDFAAFAASWMECGRYPVSACE